MPMRWVRVQTHGAMARVSSSLLLTTNNSVRTSTRAAGTEANGDQFALNDTLNNAQGLLRY